METTAALAPWTRAVSPALLCGTARGRRHWADCYRRACDYVLAHAPRTGHCPPIDGMRLVHGVCGDARAIWAHAWVELPGSSQRPGTLVFDGVRQDFYDRDGYHQVLCAVEEVAYDPPTMVSRLRASGRYGPWHDGVLGRAATRRIPPAVHARASAAGAPAQRQLGPVSPPPHPR